MIFMYFIPVLWYYNYIIGWNNKTSIDYRLKPNKEKDENNSFFPLQEIPNMV